MTACSLGDRLRLRAKSIVSSWQPVTVSVVINTLNRCESLRSALAGLERQTYRAFEVIVVDGPSTDRTQELLAEFRGRVRAAHCAEARLGLSRNIGVALAAGEVVAFLDDDAVPEISWLAELVAPYRDPSVGGVGGPVFDLPLDEVAWRVCSCSRLGAAVQTLAQPPPGGPGADPFLYLPGANMSFRRAAIVEAGGFNRLFTHLYDDVEISCRVSDRGHRLRLLGPALVRHGRVPNALRDRPDRITDPYPILHARAVFALQCEHSSHGPDEVAFAIGQMAAALIEGADRSLEAGAYTRQEHEFFSRRAREGAQDGLVDGAQPRSVEDLGDASVDDFRLFRA